jgi:uncharacterized membrane protein YhiD involved in acid resistance
MHMNPLENFYNLNPTEISGGIIIFNLVFAFLLMLVVVYTYKKTRHGLSHSRSFAFTLVIIGVLGSAIMMAVQNNIIGAFAVFGAFTLIRFRTILKETSDLAYVFYALVVGISVGMNHYPLAFLTVIVLSIIIALMHRFSFGTVSDNFDYLLLFLARPSFTMQQLQPMLEGHVREYELLHVKRHSDQLNEYAVSIHLKQADDLQRVWSALQQHPEIENMEVLTGKHTSEY